MAGTGPEGSLETVDLNDPCALCIVLQRAFLLLVAGMREVRVMFRDGESMEQVDFGQGNMTQLAIERTKARMDCKALTEGRPARRAIIAG